MFFSELLAPIRSLPHLLCGRLWSCYCDGGLMNFYASIDFIVIQLEDIHWIRYEWYCDAITSIGTSADMTMSFVVFWYVLIDEWIFAWMNPFSNLSSICVFVKKHILHASPCCRVQKSYPQEVTLECWKVPWWNSHGHMAMMRKSTMTIKHIMMCYLLKFGNAQSGSLLWHFLA